MTISDSTFASYTGKRDDVLALIDGRPSRILDVGCSDGTASEPLVRAGSEVTGVEPDADLARSAAGRLSRVLHANAEEALERLAREHDLRFDLVLFADVLEHMRAPGDVLAAAGALLTAGGQCVVSLPNVRFWTTFAELGLHGRWPRKARGVHDRTHLTWFTDRDAREMFQLAGFRVELAAQNTRLFDDPARRGNRVARHIARGPLRPFLVYQNLYRLRRL